VTVLLHRFNIFPLSLSATAEPKRECFHYFEQNVKTLTFPRMYLYVVIYICYHTCCHAWVCPLTGHPKARWAPSFRNPGGNKRLP